MIFGYARVTIGNQGREAQVAALRKAGARHIVTDNIAGNPHQRQQLDRLLTTLEKGDTLLVIRVNRLVSSMADLLAVLATIRQRGANFRSLSEPWAYIDAEMAEFMIGIFSGVAKLERDFLQARMADGRARAKAMGKSLGRSPRLSKELREAARDMLKAGRSVRKVASLFNVGSTTIWRLAHEHDAVRHG